MSMLNLWWGFSIYVACSIYGQHAQFMLYVEHAQFMLPQNDSLIVQIHPVDQKILWYWFWSQLICTVTGDLASQLDWPWKSTSKWLFECQNLSSGSKDTMIMILKSADLYSHRRFGVTIRLALKNYPKMTLWLSKSVQWIKRYSDNDFEVSWFVQLQFYLYVSWFVQLNS